MKLFYSPSYSGFVYTDSSRLMFNERLVDTAALVEEIKLHAGLSTESKEDIERTVDYYKAMKTYMEKNPSNVLKASFDVDGLSVAKECLIWRDTLTFAGWNHELFCKLHHQPEVLPVPWKIPLRLQVLGK